jgi:hypothetical protein
MDFVVLETNRPRMVHECSNLRVFIREFVQNSWMECPTGAPPQIPVEPGKSLHKKQEFHL